MLAFSNIIMWVAGNNFKKENMRTWKPNKLSKVTFLNLEIQITYNYIEIKLVFKSKGKNKFRFPY